jgi:hypothetical protein
MSTKAASEAEIGELHSLITKIHNIKAGSMLELIKKLLDVGADPEVITLSINTRDMATMQKWVEYNKVSCVGADEDEDSELSKKLRSIKASQEGKIINFKDPYDQTG